MVTIVKSGIDTYKEMYNDEKFINECYKLLINNQEKRIKQLEQENRAYKVLLKFKLNEDK